jgi:hypothetical protein
MMVDQCHLYMSSDDLVHIKMALINHHLNITSSTPAHLMTYKDGIEQPTSKYYQ